MYPSCDYMYMYLIMSVHCRPQYDDCGVAMILVHDIKKDFYKKFIYEPFPVESKSVLNYMWIHFVPFSVLLNK